VEAGPSSPIIFLIYKSTFEVPAFMARNLLKNAGLSNAEFLLCGGVDRQLFTQTASRVSKGVL